MSWYQRSLLACPIRYTVYNVTAAAADDDDDAVSSDHINSCCDADIFWRRLMVNRIMHCGANEKDTWQRRSTSSVRQHDQRQASSCNYRAV